jgi:hypothetical protein
MAIKGEERLYTGAAMSDNTGGWNRHLSCQHTVQQPYRGQGPRLLHHVIRHGTDGCNDEWGTQGRHVGDAEKAGQQGDGCKQAPPSEQRTPLKFVPILRSSSLKARVLCGEISCIVLAI